VGSGAGLEALEKSNLFVVCCLCVVGEERLFIPCWPVSTLSKAGGFRDCVSGGCNYGHSVVKCTDGATGYCY